MGAWLALVGGLAAAGGTAYSASQRPDQPDPINYGAQTGAALRAQIRQAPALLGAHQLTDPGYAALEEQLLIQRLLGSEATSRTVTSRDTVPWGSGNVAGGGWTPLGNSGARAGGGLSDFERSFLDQGVGGSLGAEVFGGGESEHPRWQTGLRTQTVNTPATRGLLDILERDIQPSVSRLQTQADRARVEGENNILRDLGPGQIEALKRANPGAAALIDELTSQAQSDLELGGELSSQQRREIAQSVRTGQAQRGMGFSPSDVFAEAMQTSDASEALKSSRRTFAGGAAQLSQGFYGDPFMRMFGRSSGTVPDAGSLIGQASGGRTGSFNPESPLAASIAGTNFNAGQANYIGGQNNFNATLGAGVGNIGQLLAAAMRNQGQAPGYNNADAGWDYLRMRGT